MGIAVNKSDYQMLQCAADDMAMIEIALYAIRLGLPPRVPAIHAPLPINRTRREYIARPDLPRCRHQPCRNPATYPLGLCPSHFIRNLGHKFTQETQYVWQGGWMICEYCGSRHRCEEHVKSVYLKERCRGRPLTERSRRLLGEEE